ncbi:MAG: dihydroorotase [Eubacterium sp.]|nr:dihydroorotase [Eubacterium sp.]
MSILIKGGRVINPDKNFDDVADILIEDGVITKIAEGIDVETDDVIDANGCFVMPGLIDMHVHFRDPGQTEKEDIETGSRAAVHGGFTTVCCMPNTVPPIDSVETVKYVVDKAKEVNFANVLPVGAVTKGMQGKEITDIAAMKEAGICAISEDGKSVMDVDVYRQAMQEAAKVGIPVLAHCEDIELVQGGVMNLGAKSEQMGMKGISNEVEDVIAQRDINLAEETGARLHLCHCSTRDSVKMMEVAKAKGLPITGEVCPHHFSLCTDDITSDNANFKMNPPLREREDMEVLVKGLSDDIMPIISTDHAPHTEEEKSKSIADAPFGIVGLETSVGLTITNLVKPGHLTPMQMAEKMSYNPAKVLGIDRGTLNEGAVADVTIINPDETYVVDTSEFESKGKNTPFGGRLLNGRVKATIVDGRIVYEEK